ncbi:chromate transporter [Paraclostridium ghonii]|uniref:chromate transporter n=1 Tax=Paraclostridium ghonii TaxID=29358 RepID=UPI00202D003A|nr:chromate transporter [Paeniclostridium ghonii]MCM0165369.1 chromate transporter [Paeniclostridium ghonii]
MSKTLMLFLIFFKIGSFSFGGGYAMLPFIQQEFIDKYHFITSKEFLDLLALSQSTPGPIAINSATFVGFKVGGFWGALASSIGVILFSVIGLTIISSLFDKFKDNEKVEKILSALRPITLGFILSAVFSSATDINWGLYDILAFLSAFYLLYTKKIGSISVVFIYGCIGILLSFI